jgi:hypothetical protein
MNANKPNIFAELLAGTSTRGSIEINFNLASLGERLRPRVVSFLASLANGLGKEGDPCPWCGNQSGTTQDEIIQALKIRVREGATNGGTDCPVCEKNVEVDKCALARRHVVMLIRMRNRVRLEACKMHSEFAHPLKLTTYTLPKHFGLIEPCADNKWCLTEKCLEFLAGREKIDKCAYVLNDTVIFRTEEKVNVGDVWKLNKPFDINDDVFDLSEFNAIESEINGVLRLPPTV